MNKINNVNNINNVTDRLDSPVLSRQTIIDMEDMSFFTEIALESPYQACSALAVG